MKPSNYLRYWSSGAKALEVSQPNQNPYTYAREIVARVGRLAPNGLLKAWKTTVFDFMSKSRSGVSRANGNEEANANTDNDLAYILLVRRGRQQCFPAGLFGFAGLPLPIRALD